MAIQVATATFNGAQSLDGDLPFVDITWPTAFASASAYEVFAGVGISDGGGVVVINEKKSARTGSGTRLWASSQFSGTVPVIAVPL